MLLLPLLLVLAACSTPRATETAPVPPSLFEPDATAARVASANEEYRFVVLDFSGHAMPPIGTRLKVYRDQQPVGTVQITEPMRGRFATADILDGEARMGDEAR